jgi:hypothetical protein
VVIECKKCGSDNWKCWDEQMEVFVSEDNPDEYGSLPVAYLVCRDCGYSTTDGHWPGWKWAGRNESEAFGWHDG